LTLIPRATLHFFSLVIFKVDIPKLFHIDDKDIEYLYNTLERVISLLSSFTSVEDEKEGSMKQLVT
jgi:hypothetical protein